MAAACPHTDSPGADEKHAKHGSAMPATKHDIVSMEKFIADIQAAMARTYPDGRAPPMTYSDASAMTLSYLAYQSRHQDQANCEELIRFHKSASVTFALGAILLVMVVGLFVTALAKFR